jgi:hypothetical protein
MCGGAYFQHGDETRRMFFPNPQAVLPVLKKDGSQILIPWGRRQDQLGRLPLGGWAKLESIYGGVWEKYFARPVKIPVLAFMEKRFSWS